MTREGIPTGNPAGNDKQRDPWEKRHKNDGRGPLAENPTGVPDRDAALPEGTAGEAAPLTGDGFQVRTETVHPSFPDQAPAEQESTDAPAGSKK